MEEFTSISKSQYMTHQNHTALFLKASTALLKSHQNVNKVKMQTLQQNFISRAFPNRAGW